MKGSFSRALALGLLCVSLAAWPAGAQTIRRTQAEGRGWIGVTVGISSTVVEGRESSFVTITGTVDGGPADRAGMVPGDSILAINGRRLTLRAWNRLTSSFTPGDDVRFLVRRAGREREVAVHVGLRPDNVRAPRQASGVSAGYSYEWDSVQRSITRQIDSVRAHYTANVRPLLVVTGDSVGVQVRIAENLARIGQAVSAGVGWTGSVFTFGTDSAGSSFRFQFESGGGDEPMSDPVLVGPRTLDVEAPLVGLEGVPFDVLWLNSPQADSTRAALSRAQRTLRRTQANMVRRQRELERAQERLALEDVTLRRLNAEKSRTEVEIRRLNAELKEIGDSKRLEESPSTRLPAPRLQGMRSLEVRATSAGVGGATSAPPPTLSARLVGQSFVAGAQLVDLNPGLSEYFGVREGVLVMEVLDGSPAARAKLLPGDVIVRVEDRDVDSMSELRSALQEQARRDQNAITVVRRGDYLRLSLPR